ncbi:hypothetical protein BpHYR1_007112 [Brachionus plicatilis]|uniref:Uncharacterized protein n=1 Tax=Brachionus plicatilis TaxID=10195 RepID=A0A3M7SJB6_BRAPC|nr:hypothetical protein BpHYR1_007112 [Brachionus plicatilis]
MLVLRAREHEGFPFGFSGIRERSRNINSALKAKLFHENIMFYDCVSYHMCPSVEKIRPEFIALLLWLTF